MDLTGNIDDMISYVSTDSREHIHDKIISMPMTEAMEIQEFMNLIKPEEYMDLPKLMPIIFTDELMSRIVLNCNNITSDQTCALKSALNPRSRPLETNEDIAKSVFARRKVVKKNNLNSMNKNESDKESQDYQSKRKKIFLSISRCLPKIKKMLRTCIILLFLYLIFIFLYTVSLNNSHEDNNTLASAVVKCWKKEILDLDEIVQIVTEHLQQDSSLLKVVALIGTSVDDQSYTLNIIKNRLRRRNANDFLSSHSAFVALKNWRAERSVNFVRSVINFVKTYQKTHGDQRVTILTDFKVEQMDNDSVDLNRTINTIKDTFIRANINIKIIPYEPLSEETLEKYIINTAENIRLTLTQDQIDDIKKRLIEDNDECGRICGNVESQLTICD